MLTDIRTRLKTKTEAHLSDEEGNITIFSIFMLMLILVFTGAAVDIMRFEAVRAKMQSAMDRAVLAAADLDQQQDPKLVVENYLQRAGVQNINAAVDISQSEYHRTVKATGQSELDTFFLRLSGIDNLTAPALSIAEEKISNVEVSLVLDISGSMRENERMDHMRPGAKAFVDKVMTDESNGVTTLNVIPFAGHVNPGGSMFAWLRGERPKLNENNGWGNGDQDAPGGSLCTNNAENAEEGAMSAECTDGEVSTQEAATGTGDGADAGYFTKWDQAISNVVFYFDTDTDGAFDDRTDIAHKIEDLPETAPRDVDDFLQGAVAYMMAMDDRLTDPAQFLGASVKGGTGERKYFQVKGNGNGNASDLGPTKNTGKIPGTTYKWNDINFVAWAMDFIDPNDTIDPATTTDEETVANQKVNMPSSCVEIYSEEFLTTEMPQSKTYVPHFMYWPLDEATMDWGWCPEDDSAIQYYSDNKESLKTFIDNLRLHDGTGIQYGMKYALALLDPNMRDGIDYLITQGLVDDKFTGRPIDWNDGETEKFIVLLSDGETSNQWRPTQPNKPANGETPLSEQPSDASEIMYSKDVSRTHLQEQCTLAKQNGVTVFTIAYETSGTASADLKACASSESHFFETDIAGVIDTFDTIARQINNLRLIQ